MALREVSAAHAIGHNGRRRQQKSIGGGRTLYARVGNSYAPRPCSSRSPSHTRLEPQCDSLELFYHVTGAFVLFVVVEPGVGTVVRATRRVCAAQTTRYTDDLSKSSLDDYTEFLDVARRLLWRRRLKRVRAFDINPSSSLSRARKACIQAKQAHRPFLAEAWNRSNTAGERVMSDFLLHQRDRDLTINRKAGAEGGIQLQSDDDESDSEDGSDGYAFENNTSRPHSENKVEVMSNTTVSTRSAEVDIPNSSPDMLP
ncbi:hypothetical protein EXIGLDRAFT_703125 [Exidia glandulosa HHB12029]|uniref:Uncharacterized protein n=1 Tax=Exidia glandulosa HHB12029 TaxID=1314781 RepID=A0A165ZED8_EXIGL|nr:hypothetical protein EXIGLDRAFT_703125 [Exidia glandulosa HHB12029]